MLSSLENIGLTRLQQVLDALRGLKSDSLIEYTKSMRVEPICIIDSNALSNDILPNVLQSNLSLFAGYYLQAVAMSTTVGKVHVGATLDRLNPSRSPVGSMLDSAAFALAHEHFSDKLPTSAKDWKLATEALGDGLGNGHRGSDESSESSVGFGRDSVKSLKELSDLSVGKIFEVEIQDGLHRATFPIAVRLMASVVDGNDLKHILTYGAKDNTAKDLYWAWKEGRLDFVEDILFCRHLIREHRKNMVKDKSGIYQEIASRRSGNKLATLLSGRASVSQVANIAIITAETAHQIETEINGKLDNFKVRDKLLHDTGIMLLTVIDTKWDQITIYHDSLPLPTELSFRDIKASQKGSGPDVADILKAYQVGQAPSF